MAVISEVKCGRCDRRYSGFRSRCPYCGARRNKRGKHADDTENAKAKILVGIVLLVVLIIATIVLICTRLPDKASKVSTPSSSAALADAKPTLKDDETNNTSLTTNNGKASASPTGSASPSADPNAKVTAVSVTINGSTATDVTLKVGESAKVGFTTTPASTGKVGVWKSEDPTVASVSNNTVTALSKGTVTLSVTVDGIQGKCTIRIRSK